MTDTRSVVVTNDSVVIDGCDVSNMVTAVDINVRAGGFPPRVWITATPGTVLYSGPAVVPDFDSYIVADLPLDGIERLRQRLRQQ
jgi:hypothetical protein